MYANVPNDVTCDICDTRKSKHLNTSFRSPSELVTASDFLKELDVNCDEPLWFCSHCEYPNIPIHLSCNICGTAKGAGETLSEASTYAVIATD
jgi:hypothetical protein